MELPLQQQQQQQASPAPRLNILSATWGPRTGKKVAVTHLLQRWVQIHGAGAYLHLPTLEAKKELDLCIKYCLDNGEVYEETFGELRGVLLDDVSLYYISITSQHASITADEADALLHKFRPILHLHPEEQSYPCRVEWYLHRTSLNLQYSDMQIKILDTVTSSEQLNAYYPHGGQRYHTRETRRFFLRHKPECLRETRMGERTNLAQVPFYGSCFKTPTGLVCLTYFFFYAYNGPVLHGQLVPAWISQLAGVHEGDWEHVCILIAPHSLEIRGVFMSRHGNESHWYLCQSPDPASDSGWHLDPNEGRVTIYCGKESHANYNLPGRQSRGYGGYIDDRCGHGAVWSPHAVVNLGTPANPRVPWLHYGGAWGKLKDAYVDHPGPTGPFLKNAFRAAPPMTKKNTTPVFGTWWNPNP